MNMLTYWKQPAYANNRPLAYVLQMNLNSEQLNHLILLLQRKSYFVLLKQSQIGSLSH